MKIFQKVVLIGFSGLLIFAPSYSLKAQGLMMGDQLARTIIVETNHARILAGVNVVSESTLLSRVAQRKAQSMADGSYFSHTSPSGKGPWQWLSESGYTYTEAGENLAVAYSDEWNVVNAWMNSLSHKENVLRQNFDEAGVGQAIGTYKGKPAIFIVEFLAKKKRVQ
jgi:uncharacterized protein YkwD